MHCTLPDCLSLTLHLHLQPKEALIQGPLQILDGLTSSDSSLPAGFLEDLVSRIEPDDLPNLMTKLSELSAIVLISSFAPAVLDKQNMAWHQGSCPACASITVMALYCVNVVYSDRNIE